MKFSLKISEHLAITGKLSKFQSGYKKHHSTTSTVLHIVCWKNYWSKPNNCTYSFCLTLAKLLIAYHILIYAINWKLGLDSRKTHVIWYIHIWLAGRSVFALEMLLLSSLFFFLEYRKTLPLGLFSSLCILRMLLTFYRIVYHIYMQMTYRFFLLAYWKICNFVLMVLMQIFVRFLIGQLKIN